MRVLPLLFLVGCPLTDKAETGDTAALCVSTPMARISTDVGEVDFGEVEEGGTTSAEVVVRNDGDFPLGLEAIRLGEGLDDFALDVESGLLGSACASLVGDGVIVLDPGCELALGVSYTPATTWGAADAVVITTVTDPEATFAADPLHSQLVVWLQGRTGGLPADDAYNYAAGSIIAAGQTALYEGESTEFEIRPFGAEVPSVTWSTDDADVPSIDAAVPFTPTYTAPEVEANGRVENVYAVLADTQGTDWVFGRITVWDRSVPLYPCD